MLLPIKKVSEFKEVVIKHRTVSYGHLVWQQLKIQMVLVFLVSLALLTQGYEASLISLLGGLLSVIPNTYFGLRVFRYSGARAVDRILNSFHKGMAGKLILTMVGFALVFQYLDVVREGWNALYLFLGFVSAVAGNWLSLLWAR